MMESMNFSGFLLLVLFLSNAIHIKQIQGKLIFDEEDLKLEKHFKRLRKTAVKTIQTITGDVYDCVGIREQPALDHPMLKNHSIQMKPFSTIMNGKAIPKEQKRTIQKEDMITVDCPEGTIPIQRIEKEDLIRAKLFAESFGDNIHLLTRDFPGRHFAILRPKGYSDKPLWGINARISLHKLENVGVKQSSSAQMWLERGSTNIQAGWMVSQQLYKDTHTRLFVYWKSNNGGCFNLLCDGFVHVEPTVPIDVVFNRTTEYKGKNMIVIMLRIQKDPKTGCWWLVIRDDIHLGYWPPGILPDLDKNGASKYAWGGMVTGPPEEPSPPMGNGHPFEDWYFNRAAYFGALEIVDSSYSLVRPGAKSIENFVDCGQSYGMTYYHFKLGREPQFLYGGTGGPCGP